MVMILSGQHILSDFIRNFSFLVIYGNLIAHVNRDYIYVKEYKNKTIIQNKK